MGIVFEKEGVLPRAWGEVNERRLPEADRKVDMNAYEREMRAAEEEVEMRSMGRMEDDIVVDSRDAHEAEEDEHTFVAPEAASVGEAAPRA